MQSQHGMPKTFSPPVANDSMEPQSNSPNHHAPPHALCHQNQMHKGDHGHAIDNMLLITLGTIVTN